MKNTILLLLLSIFFLNGKFTRAQTALAAPNGKISGTVLDAANSQPVEFAAVAVLNPTDSSIITGALTDDKGKFLIEVVNEGKYILKINYIGYKVYTKNIELNTQTTFHELGKLQLEVGSTELEKVVVNGEKPFFENQLDKKVFNVDKTIVAAGGSATDILQTIPSVSVDIDGNVSLRGSTAVRIFIDGKPSGIMGDNMAAILEQIPASTIESIELITNPSAKYEAEGTAGIINIVLKKNKQSGINGNITAGAGTAPKSDASASLNYRNKKINISTNYSFNYDDRDGYGSGNRYNFFTDTAFYYNSNTNSNSRSFNHFARAGIDYYINDQNTLSLSGSYNHSDGESFEDLNYDFFDLDSIFTSSNDRTTNGDDLGYSINTTLDYKRSFKNPKKSLTGSLYYTYGNRDNLSNYDTRDFDLSSFQIGDALFQNVTRDGSNRNLTFQTDYVLPLQKGNQAEAGFKFSGRSNDNDLYSETFDQASDSFANDTLISNHFIYDENVFAGYLTYGGSYKNLNYKVGLRGEETLTNSELITTNEFYDNDYFGLFPSVHTALDLSKTFELSLSYSRRVNRPQMMQLNPFPDFNDAFSLRFGNPFLKPEFVDSYEFGLSQQWKNHSLYATIYYRLTHDAISRFVTVDTSGVSRATFANLNSSGSYGVELIFRDQFFKWWTTTTSFNFFQTELDATNIESGLTNNVFSWSGKVISNFQLMKETSLQLSFNYMSPWVMPQGVSLPMYSLDAGMKSDFFKNKLTLNVTMSDIFNTRKFGMTSEGINYSSDFYRKRESRILYGSLTYRFGKVDNTKRRPGKNADQPDMQNSNYDMY